jgi:hypothetical protein
VVVTGWRPFEADATDGSEAATGRKLLLYQGRMARLERAVAIFFLPMRVNIKARIPIHLHQEFHRLPLVLTIEKTRGMASRCEHRTTASQLMWTLDQKTDINANVLDRFQQKLKRIEEANLTDVEVSDEVLGMFGFFR